MCQKLRDIQMSNILLFLGLLCTFVSFTCGSFDQGYGHSEPVYESHGHNYHHQHKEGSGGHSAGSYYHYHVPVVGQSYGHQQAHSSISSHDHHIWALLLLLGISLLSAKLLPLLLIPLGLSLLALLLGGGMMMAMMMMMMMGEMMMMPNARTEHVGRAIDLVGQLGQAVGTGDISGLVLKYMSSIDMDDCPQRLICEMGSKLFPENSTITDTFKTTQSTRISSYIIKNVLPKGKAKRTFRQFEKAFLVGSNTQNCESFHCKPQFNFQHSNDGFKTGDNPHPVVYNNYNHDNNNETYSDLNVSSIPEDNPESVLDQTSLNNNNVNSM